MERWTGRTAIVTGASSGIGAAIAAQLVRSGLNVVGVARRPHLIQALAADLGQVEGQLHALQCDVTMEEDVVRVVTWTRDNLGGADVLVNCAGLGSFMPLPDIDATKMRTIFDTNVIGLSMFTSNVIKDMMSRGVDDGHIFHIGSVVGHRLVEFPGAYVYSGSKHTVRVFTEGLRRELRDSDTRIKVTGLSPGMVRSNFMASAGVNPQLALKMKADNPFLEPSDVADALIYALATPPHVQVHDITLLPLGQKHV